MKFFDHKEKKVDYQTNSAHQCCIRIPKEEIHHRLCSLFKQMRKEFNITNEPSEHFIYMLLSGDINGFENQIGFFLLLARLTMITQNITHLC
jgi:hypothetical protein